MSWVFSARHLKLDRRAAVKVLYPEMTEDAEYVRRFFSEARLANEVRHPNVIEIFDFIATDEPRRVACIMELLGGMTLEKLIKSGPMPPLQALNVALQLADALAAVHAKGVVHRDLKPGNVMIIGDTSGDLSERPSLKILDFGIAKSVDVERAVQLTRTGMIIGTPSYMAPEQIAGERVGPATDLYALAEILYEMFQGRRLFEGEFVAIFRAKLLGELPELQLPAGTPFGGEMSELMRACLREVAAERPPLKDVRMVLEALRDQLAGHLDPNTSLGDPSRTSILSQELSTGEIPSQLRYARILSALDEASSSGNRPGSLRPIEDLGEEGTELAFLGGPIAETDPQLLPPPAKLVETDPSLQKVPIHQVDSEIARGATEPGQLRSNRGRSVANIVEQRRSEPQQPAWNPRSRAPTEPVPPESSPEVRAPETGVRTETKLAALLLLLSIVLFGLAVGLWIRGM